MKQTYFSAFRRAHGAARILFCLLAAVASLPAQLYHAHDYYPHHNFTFGAGAAQPQADLKSYFISRPGISIGYGYRFQKYFQADLGLDMVFGAAHVRDYIDTSIGPLRIGDRQYFVPFGGRAILPLFEGRFLISGGAGGAYLRYAETLHQPSSYFKVDCPVCLTRDGWGYYALAEADYFLDSSQHFRIGAVVKSFRGHTQGDSLAGVPYKSTDRWLNILGQFGFCF